MSRSLWMGGCVLGFGLVTACSETQTVDSDSDISKIEDLTDIDAERDSDDGEAVPDELDAARYCEESAAMFCDYYVRCGRMAVADRDECRVVFLETCNGRYEPLYADLAERGALHLSRSGLERCAARLSTIACEQQIFDLDGCPDVWVGGHVAGDKCGPGLESFVCQEDTVCVLGLDFCGTCKAVTAGESCDLDVRCRDTEVCRDGSCVGRRAVGEACGNPTPPCVLGASCVEGICRGPQIVGLGEICDQARRCPYRSQCAAGRCVRTELVGESCGGDVGCASGYCEGEMCTPLKGTGDTCMAGSACVSGRCEGGLCRAITWPCLEVP